MPSLGSKGTILEWVKVEGEPVQEGETLCKIEFDDFLIDLESQHSGILSAIKVRPESGPIFEGEEIARISHEGDEEEEASATEAHVDHESSGVPQGEVNGLVMVEMVKRMVAEGHLPDEHQAKALLELAVEENETLRNAFVASFPGDVFYTAEFERSEFLNFAKGVIETRVQHDVEVASSASGNETGRPA